MTRLNYQLVLLYLSFITLAMYLQLGTNAYMLPNRYHLAPYANDYDSDAIMYRHMLVPLSSVLSTRMHKRGPELIIPFISGGAPAKKSDDVE
uniref:Glycosyltransferase n=1 Tax=Trichobilharzia regenti TaxID=157069 RepID=A0AA85IYT9_TRIRE|nr:unnamed protein product [Trichobilharzia regenti]